MLSLHGNLTLWPLVLTGLCFLPSAYVVRREGNVLTGVCLSFHKEWEGDLTLDYWFLVFGPRSFQEGYHWSLVPGSFLGKGGTSGLWSQILSRGKGVPLVSGPRSFGGRVPQSGLGTGHPSPPPPSQDQNRVPPPPGQDQDRVFPHSDRTCHEQNIARAVCLLRFHAGGLSF